MNRVVSIFIHLAASVLAVSLLLGGEGWGARDRNLTLDGLVFSIHAKENALTAKEKSIWQESHRQYLENFERQKAEANKNPPKPGERDIRKMKVLEPDYDNTKKWVDQVTLLEKGVEQVLLESHRVDIRKNEDYFSLYLHILAAKRDMDDLYLITAHYGSLVVSHFTKEKDKWLPRRNWVISEVSATEITSYTIYFASPDLVEIKLLTGSKQRTISCTKDGTWTKEYPEDPNRKFYPWLQPEK